MTLADRLAASPAVRAAGQAVGDRDGVWIVGGAVREAATGREVGDVDLAVAGDERDVARAVAESAG